ncbi:TM2 domain-containing protein [Brachybacterium sp.]|uniref:TM2 domain-containing protein n=1 Tax=Brachybacterium sp. TaxID=1891286 RepID=UPI002ED69D49
MSNPGDYGSWNPQGDDFNAQGGQPAQDPWAQPASGAPQYGQQDPYAQQPGAGQDPYGQQDPYAQQPGPGQDPYGVPSSGSASDPYGQQNWSPAPGTGASASDPYGQQAPAGAAGAAPHEQPQGQAQSRLVVGLLGIFLGGFGVHRFLLGYTTIGIIQIAVTLVTCGIGAWWGVIEGILVLVKSPSFERDAHGRPLTD